MSDMLKINVLIADKSYPLTIDASQKEDLEKASKRVNLAVEDFIQKYDIRDRRDILAMVALQFAVLLEKEAAERTEIQERLKRLSQTLSHDFDNGEAGDV